jgi:hypothetical protein
LKSIYSENRPGLEAVLPLRVLALKFTKADAAQFLFYSLDIEKKIFYFLGKQN